MLVHPLSSSPATTAPHTRAPRVLWTPVFILFQLSQCTRSSSSSKDLTVRRQVHPILYEADGKQVPVGLLATGVRKFAVVPYWLQGFQ